MVFFEDATTIDQSFDESENEHLSMCAESPDLVAALVGQHPLISLKTICLPWQRQTPPHTRPVAHFSTQLLFQEYLGLHLKMLSLRLSPACRSSLPFIFFAYSWSNFHSKQASSFLAPLIAAHYIRYILPGNGGKQSCKEMLPHSFIFTKSWRLKLTSTSRSRL